jgi:hypothetical protein
MQRANPNEHQYPSMLRSRVALSAWRLSCSSVPNPRSRWCRKSVLYSYATRLISAWLLISARLLAKDEKPPGSPPPNEITPLTGGILVVGAIASTHAFFRFVTRISSGIFHPPANRDRARGRAKRPKYDIVLNDLEIARKGRIIAPFQGRTTACASASGRGLATNCNKPEGQPRRRASAQHSM